MAIIGNVLYMRCIFCLIKCLIIIVYIIKYITKVRSLTNVGLYYASGRSLHNTMHNNKSTIYQSVK